MNSNNSILLFADHPQSLLTIYLQLLDIKFLPSRKRNPDDEDLSSNIP